MRLPVCAAALLPLASAEIYSKAQYQSGHVMAKMMAAKESAWAKHRAAGLYDSKQWNGFNQARRLPGPVQCIDGKVEAVAGDANQTYACKNIDMYDFKTHAELGSEMGEGSGSWGWTDGESKRDFMAIGQADGAAFAEVTSEGQLVYLGRLPPQSTPVIWREIKSNGPYMVIGSEAEDHGIQIFDMRKLLNVDPSEPKTFSTTDDIALFNDLPIGRSHNVVVNEENNYAVAVGAAPRDSPCASGLIFINMDDPENPYSPGCSPQDGYVHDAQCIVYRGPDEKYNGRDICYGYNEDSLTIYDVTNKTGPQAGTVISRTAYKGATYTHQGWVLDPMWQTHLVMDDELDEGEIDPAETNPESLAIDGFPVTYIWDITSLEAPKNTGYYKSSTRSVDHNQFVYDGLAYQSNYQAGLRVLDVSTIPEDPTGRGVEEIAFFDVYPLDDDEEGGGVATWDFGTWSHYTFASGWIVVNTIDRGVFVVKMSEFRQRGFGKRWLRRG